MVTPFMIQIADFLNTVLISNSFIFVNLWSVIHCIVGFFIMKYIAKKDFVILFCLLIAYEAFEIMTIYNGYTLFRAELGIDILFDILIGLLGGWVATKW